jgi:hypothetical protein
MSRTGKPFSSTTALILVLAEAGLGLYDTSTLFPLASVALSQEIFGVELSSFVAAILIMIWEAVVGSRTLLLNSRD